MANSADELNALLDQVRDKMVESGMTVATAEAVLFGARPAIVDIRGNLADVQRMGAKQVVVTADAATVTGEGEILTAGDVMGEVLTEPTNAPSGPGSGTVGDFSDSNTKAELLAEAKRRGVDADDSLTKAEILERLGA